MAPSKQPAHRVSTRIRRLQAGTRGKDFDIFQPFPLLPLELRFQVWTATLPGPQIHSPSDADHFDLRFPPERIAHDPVTLWITRESRAVALQHYQLRDLEHLRWYRKHDKKKFHHAAYVDYSIDQFVFSSKIQFDLPFGEKALGMVEHFPRFLAKSEHSLVRDIHIFSGDYESTRNQLRELLEGWLPVLTGLKRFTFSITLQVEDLIVEEGVEVHLRGGSRWVVNERDVGYRQFIGDEMEKYRLEKLGEDVVWEVPDWKFEFVRVEMDEALGRWFYQF